MSIPSGTVTFLFTDIEGSTKLAREHRTEWERARGRHDASLRSAIEAWHGHVFQVVGDAFCASFHTAEDALQAALESQRTLQSEPWGEVPIKVRMGLNTGSAQAGTGPDGALAYTGYSTLARTQRVMSTAYGEQVLLSNTSAELMLGELPQGVTLRDMKEHRLKGLLNPEHLWQAVTSGVRQDFPALQSLNSIPNNLPLQLTSFIGREKEIAEILRLVEANRLVTLTGSGGVGKTRHALQVGAEILDAFPDGVWFVDLAAITNPELVVHAIAAALGVREDPNQPMLDVLKDHLASRRTLILLDNCEHLLEPCARCADTILRACPHVKIVASSREALGVTGEVSFQVTSMALPDPQHLPAVEILTQYDSVRLFIERAVSAKPDFVLTSANGPAVAQICARLDGIPLAIELAAARVKGISAEQISTRLDDRFRLLTGGSRTALPRHQTLRAMIEWSHDLLTEPERVVFRRSAAFVGDWSLDAAEAVCQGDPIAPADVLDLLLRLVDRSLVAANERGGQERYRMLESIADFARQKLAESGEEDAVRERHLEFFVAFAEAAGPHVEGAEAFIWLNGHRSEYDNLESALARAGALPADSSLGLARATAHLAAADALLGMRTRAIALYQRALERLRDASAADPVLELELHCKVVQTLCDLNMTTDLERFKALRDGARPSVQALERAVQAGESSPPSAQLARAFTTLAAYSGYVAETRRPELMEQYALRAVGIAEALDAPTELALALDMQFKAYWLRGRFREAVEVARRRVEHIRDPRIHDAFARGWAMIDHAYSLIAVGRYAEAVPVLTEAASYATQIQSVEIEKQSFAEMTHALFRLDRWDGVLDLDDKLRDMQRRYPMEQVGPACYDIAVFAAIHALRGDMGRSVSQRDEAQTIMLGLSGSTENWVKAQHY
jgi:predicted ATPase/class 3 adenylate cyclase